MTMKGRFWQSHQTINLNKRHLHCFGRIKENLLAGIDVIISPHSCSWSRNTETYPPPRISASFSSALGFRFQFFSPPFFALQYVVPSWGTHLVPNICTWNWTNPNATFACITFLKWFRGKSEFSGETDYVFVFLGNLVNILYTEVNEINMSHCSP